MKEKLWCLVCNRRLAYFRFHEIDCCLICKNVLEERQAKNIANLEMVKGVLQRARLESSDFTDTEMETLFKATPETIKSLKDERKKKEGMSRLP